MRACATLWICTAGFLFLTSPALAHGSDGYEMKRSKLAGGGGSSTGGGYELAATIGQPVGVAAWPLLDRHGRLRDNN